MPIKQIEWKSYFRECGRPPLNASQQRAVLLNDDNTLISPGAGSGKTSVLMAKVGYLLQSGQAKPEEMLLVAFGRDAAKEMQQRIKEKFAETRRSNQIANLPSIRFRYY